MAGETQGWWEEPQAPEVNDASDAKPPAEFVDRGRHASFRRIVHGTDVKGAPQKPGYSADGDARPFECPGCPVQKLLAESSAQRGGGVAGQNRSRLHPNPPGHKQRVTHAGTTRPGVRQRFSPQRTAGDRPAHRGGNLCVPTSPCYSEPPAFPADGGKGFLYLREHGARRKEERCQQPARSAPGSGDIVLIDGEDVRPYTVGSERDGIGFRNELVVPVLRTTAQSAPTVGPVRTLPSAQPVVRRRKSSS